MSCQATSCGVRSISTLLWPSAPLGELDGRIGVRESAALEGEPCDCLFQKVHMVFPALFRPIFAIV